MPLVLAVFVVSHSGWAAPAKPKGSDRSVSLEVPGELGNQGLARWGFIDVTAAPFQADPSGQKDSTKSLQEAIIFASQHQMVCFFPPGKYRVSDTLVCEHARYNPQTKTFRPGRDWPCVLVGSRNGSGRPTIVLAPNSPGFSDPAKPKFVVNFFSRDAENPDQVQDNINMNQMLVGIDVQIGPDNPGAIGIRHRAAQGSSIQDCTIDATPGLAGLSGGAGSGGSHFNVTILGGKFGADLRDAQPAPTIAGFTFINQRETAILYNGRQTLTVVGCRITATGKGPAIVAGLPERQYPNGQVSLVDSSVEFTDGGDHVAIQAGSNVYLNNVFLRGTKTILAPHEVPVRESCRLSSIHGQWHTRALRRRGPGSRSLEHAPGTHRQRSEDPNPAARPAGLVSSRQPESRVVRPLAGR